MLKNYLKTAIRNFFKERRYSAINLIGLAVGVAVAILMLLYAVDEWSFDRFHPNSDRLYRAWVKEHYQGELFFNTNTPFILGEELTEGFPEVAGVAQYLVLNNLVKRKELSDQENIHLMTPSMLELFNFPLLTGRPDQVLSGMQQVVLTPRLAEKYFGAEDPIGQSLSIQIGGKWLEYQVSGVIADPPAQSSIRFDLLIPFENVKKFIPPRGLTSWTTVYPETYVLLREGVTAPDLEAKLQPVIDQRVAGNYEPGEYIVGLQPITDIHLNNDYPTGIAPVSDWRYPYIMSGLALLILLLAGINFVTLAVGRSVARAREVGVRKVAGASRWQIMQQFWSEALLLSFLALILGVLLAEILLPFFNQLADKELVFHYTPATVIALLGLALFIGLLAGIYPALVISGFSPQRTIQGDARREGAGRHLILQGLVGFQFVLSIGLIASTLLMQRQLNYLQNKNLGYNQEQKVVLPYSEAPGQDKSLGEVYEEGKRRAELLKRELAGRPEIQGLTTSSHTFGTPGWYRGGYTDQDGQFRQFFQLTVDYDYLPAMGIRLQSGRNFTEQTGTDEDRAVIVNATMAEQWGLATGQPMPKPFEALTVVGITEDFNFTSLHSPVEPLLMAIDPSPVRQQFSDAVFGDFPTPKITLDLAKGDVARSLALIEKAWQRVAPDQPFNITFMDEAVGQQYRSEQRLGHILLSATALAILIACLGLFGMATLTISQRTKEIGVRRVLGASVIDIVLLLNKQLSWTVVIATAVAAPLAWWFMHTWLEDFTYRTTLNPLLFGLAGLAALFLAWIAVSLQSVQAARANPVEALRSE